MASTARLDELKKKFDENPRRYFAPLANEHRKSGNLDQAITLCQAHLPQQPAHISGHIVLGQALFEAGQVDESRETFLTALELDPENLIALRYLGDIARTGGDVDTARSWYHRVLEVDPRNDEIEQLVRDLDAPPAAEPTEDLAATAEAMETVPVADEGREPLTPVVDHSRFEPLTVDQIDTDTELFAPSGDSTQSDSHAASAGAATNDIPLLDLPELDPYETPANAGAETLLRQEENASETVQQVPLLDGLTVSGGAVDFGNLQASSQPASNTVAGSETAESHASTPIERLPEFDDSSFYLEPAPSAPAASQSPDEWSASRAMAESTTETSRSEETESLSAARASADAASEDRAGEWETAPSPSMAPNADASDVDLVESSSAPSAPAEVPADDALGLEVMEFVPPVRSERPRIDAPTAADPLVGHMPELTAPATTDSTPDAFVTETMAELYLQQGFTNEALAVYRELLSRNPADTSLRERIEQIESGSMSSIGMAMLSENVVESARKRQTERAARSVRSFFASLAGRRAPYPSHQESELAAQESEAAAMDASPADASSIDASMDASQMDASPSDWGTEASMDAVVESQSEPQEVISGPSDDAFGPDAPAPAPPSAAEQMAEFDPFADAAPTRPTPRSLQDIFPETDTTPGSDAAAQTLSTAFGRSEPQGRPTRAASNELSLDRVFRGTPEGPPPAGGGFSFDQFFSDTRTGGADASTTPPAPSDSEAPRSTEGGSDAHDIEQFTAWLEGLKKK